MRRLVPTSLRWLFAPALVAALTLGASPALAQDDFDDEEIPDLPEDDGGDVLDDDTGDERGRAIAGEDEPPPAEEPAPAEVAPEVSSSPETLYVIQQKPRLIGGSFEIAPQFMQSVNDRFTSQTGFMLSGIYHLKENMAVEASLGVFAWWDFDDNGPVTPIPRLGGRWSDTTVELRDRERLAPEMVKLYWMDWLATADFQWSPIYGKVSVQDFILGQFNIYLSVGAGLVGMQLYNEAGTEPAPGAQEAFGIEGIQPILPTATVGGGFRFYFLDWLGVRFEVRDYVMALAAPAGVRDNVTLSTFEVRNTLMAQAGVSFIF